MSNEEKRISTRSRRILVIDEDRDSLGILLEPLRWEGYDAQGVSSISEALIKIQEWQPLIVLLDLKDFEPGLLSLKKIKERIPHGSCLVLSDDSSSEAIIKGFDYGADDYIVKPFVPLELLARLRTHLRIRDLHEQLVVANEKLLAMVDTDDLTGLYNMRSLYQRLEFEMQRARRFGRQVCVIMLDMDNFKSVNDGHDHLFGSYVISEVGQIIKANTRNIDIPARYGGDEFLIVLTEVNFEGSKYFCERLRRSVEAYHFKSGRDEINLTVSVGFSMTSAGEIISARELVRCADHALYEAKRRGKNQVVFYDKTMSNEEALVEMTRARHSENIWTARTEIAIKKSRQNKKKAVG
ncbi:MAG: diguanylate cyclase [Bdellovibrionota bacterium]